MDEYSFLTAFFGIILGIATAKALEGLIYPIKSGRRSEIYPLHLLASGLVILLIVQSWWGLFDDRNMGDLTFTLYLQNLLTPIAYYFMAELIAPDADATDIKAHYWRRIRAGMIVAGLSMVNNMLSDVFITGNTSIEQQGVRLIAIALTLMVALSRREWVHYIGYGAFYAAFVLFIIVAGQ